MKVMRWILRVIGSLLLISAVTIYFGDDLTKYSLDKSNRLGEVFAFAVEKIDQFQQVNNRYPTQSEFSNFKSELSAFGHYGENMGYHSSDYPNDALKAFSTPSSEGYVLSIWRGEWWEHYASWTGESTLPDSLADYYFTKSKVGDAIVVTIVGVFLFTLSYYRRSKFGESNAQK